MNSLQFDDSTTFRNARVVVEPVVASWFGYLVGSIVMIAATIFIVEVIRVELMIAQTKDRIENIEKKSFFKK